MSLNMKQTLCLRTAVTERSLMFGSQGMLRLAGQIAKEKLEDIQRADRKWSAKLGPKKLGH